MTKNMSKAGQELLDDVLSIKGGSPAKTWTPEQLLVIQARKTLVDEKGEVRELTEDDFAEMKPLKEIDPKMYEKLKRLRGERVKGK